MLTQQEAERLINLLKQTVEKVIDFPKLGEKQITDVHEINGKEKFKIDIYRGNIDSKKVTINGRHSSNVSLLRLDTGDNVLHKNIDGTIIYGPHLHIYKEGIEVLDAVPFDIKDDNLVSICIEFMKSFNIVNRPEIREQRVMYN